MPQCRSLSNYLKYSKIAAAFTSLTCPVSVCCRRMAHTEYPGQQLQFFIWLQFPLFARQLLIENNFAWHNFFWPVATAGRMHKKARNTLRVSARERERETATCELPVGNIADRETGRERIRETAATRVPSAVISCTNAHFITWHLDGPAGSCLSLPPSPFDRSLQLSATPRAVPSSGNVSALQGCHSVFPCRLLSICLFTLCCHKSCCWHKQIQLQWATTIVKRVSEWAREREGRERQCEDVCVRNAEWQLLCR